MDIVAYVVVVVLGLAIMFPLRARLAWLFSAVTRSFRGSEDDHLDNVEQIVSAAGGAAVVMGVIALVARLT